MATITLSTDDLTGETLPDGTPTTTIVISDPRLTISIELDLSDASVKALEKALSKFTAKGREYTPAKSASASTDREEATAARAWAIAARPDLKVSERGAVPTRAIEAYRAFLDESNEPAGGPNDPTTDTAE